MNPPVIRTSFRLFLASGLLLLLAACGGSQGFTSASTTSGQVEIGSVTNGVFTSGTLAVTPSTIAPGGTASVSAALEYSNGTPYAVPTTVDFSSTCVSNKESTITASVTTNASGEAVATYTAGTGCTGTDTIQATALVNGVNLIAVGSVTISSSSPAVVDAVVPSASSPPRYVTPGSVVPVGFVVRSRAGAPEVGRLLDLRVLGGPQTLLAATLVRSGPGGLAYARLSVPATVGGVRVLARLAGGNGSGVGTVSAVLHPAAFSRGALLTVVPTVLNLGPQDERVSETLLVTGTGPTGLPLADGTQVVLHASRGFLPASCVLSDGRCRVLWQQDAAVLGAQAYGTVNVSAQVASASARAEFAVVSDRALIRLVRSEPTPGGVVDLVSVTSTSGGLLPAGTRLEFRSLGGGLESASSATVPNVLATSGSCRNGADPDRGCYLVRLEGTDPELEVLSEAPGGTLSERVTGGALRARP
jgi:hypothetical protein